MGSAERSPECSASSGKDQGILPVVSEALWEETPHRARYSRHPLPKGEG